MRILVDLRSHLSDPDPDPQIVQVQRVPTEGPAGQDVINGKYAIPTPLNIDFPIDSTDYVLDAVGNIDGGDVVSLGYAHLLAGFPQFGNVYFNPLLTSDHVAELVLDQSFHFTDKSVVTPYPMFFPRFQTGREDGVADDGQMPTHTALMPLNVAVTPNRPGFIITEEIDISAYTLDCDGNSVGADDFMVFWKLYAFSVTDDIAADTGLHAGKNEPALRYIQETDQEPPDFSAYISTDGGANWCEVGLLEGVAFSTKTKSVRLAFRNDSPESKVFIASYALLF